MLSMPMLSICAACPNAGPPSVLPALLLAVHLCCPPFTGAWCRHPPTKLNFGFVVLHASPSPLYQCWSHKNGVVRFKTRGAQFFNFVFGGMGGKREMGKRTTGSQKLSFVVRQAGRSQVSWGMDHFFELVLVILSRHASTCPIE